MMNAQWGTRINKSRIDWLHFFTWGKIGFSRISSYFAIPSFLMIIGLWLDRHQSNYVMIGYGLVLVLIIILLFYEMTKIYPKEISISNRANPLAITEAIRLAIILANTKNQGFNIQPMMNRAIESMKETGMLTEFMEFYDIVESKIKVEEINILQGN